MAETTAEVRAPLTWMYVNEVRVIGFVLGAAMVVLVAGMLLYVEGGTHQLDTVDVFLGTGVFFLLFALLLFVPRLRSRGPMSFSLHVAHGMDEVELAVTAAIEASGRKWDIARRKSRFSRPPRAITVHGLAWRFTLRAAPYRESRGEGMEWTEIVQSGLTDEKDEVARDLRERVLGRLTASVR